MQITRPRISAALRSLVWNTYIGEEKGTFVCLCGSTISQLNFECGHVIPWSSGGATTIDNLRPVCSRCNRSMGTQNMFEYISKMGLSPNLFYNDKSPFLPPPRKIISNTHAPSLKRDARSRTVMRLIGKGVLWTLGTSWKIMGKLFNMVFSKRRRF